MIKNKRRSFIQIKPLAEWEKQQKTELLKSLDAYIRTKEPLIKEVSISISGVHSLGCLYC